MKILGFKNEEKNEVRDRHNIEVAREKTMSNLLYPICILLVIWKRKEL